MDFQTQHQNLEFAKLASQVQSASLNELSAMEPSLWQEVVDDLKGRIRKQNLQSLSEVRMGASADLKRWLQAVGSDITSTQHACRALLKAKMTILAYDQFVGVMTGRLGYRPTWLDRITLLRLGLAMNRGKILGCREFDQHWRHFKNPAWAAGALQDRGIWSVPTKEFCDRLARLAGPHNVLELGAGRGLLAKGLAAAGSTVTAVDDFSWKIAAGGSRTDALSLVRQMDAASAIRTLHPSVVLCAWPPPRNDFEHLIFRCPSVQVYIAVVSKLKFACGNWQAYKDQSDFKCTTSEPLNQLLRPTQSEQQVFIFRRS